MTEHPFFAGLHARLDAGMTSRSGKLALKILRWSIPVLLIAYLARRLSDLGWHEIWTARPARIGFYGLLVAQFILQPLGDFLVYGNLWGKQHPPLSVILRKRFLNSVMLDYSGEVYFYFWSQRRLKLPPGMLVHGIKDSNVLSAGAGLAMVWLVGLALLATGGLHLPPMLTGHAWIYAPIGVVPFLLCAVLILGHRKLTALSRGQIITTFAIHFLRSFSVLVVEFCLWELSGALPTAVACLQFVALRLVVTRLPLVPNKDLIFVGAGIAAAGLVSVSVTPVATVLLILAAADLILASLMAGLPWAMEILLHRKTDEAVP
jgi:hypothetical protein